MSSKLLGKVMAGAGLGAASLLICAPGTALADDAPPKQENKGSIHTAPKGVKPGHKFKIILACVYPVEKPWVSSKITGSLWLKPVVEDNVPLPRAPRPQDNSAQPAPTPSDAQPSASPNGAQPRLPDEPGLPDLEQPQLPPDETQPLSPEGTQPDDATSTDERAGGADEQPGAGEGGQAAVRYEAKYWAWAKVPHKTKPGHYAARGACNGTGKIVVLPLGAVPGGDGGASTDAGRAAVGAGMLGAAALGGFLMIRRRRTDGSPA